jgi:hypothetical protein
MAGNPVINDMLRPRSIPYIPIVMPCENAFQFASHGRMLVFARRHQGLLVAAREYYIHRIG